MGKRAFIAKLVQDIRASYWFLPSFLVCFAVALAQLMLYLDQNPNLLPFELPLSLRNTQVDGARSLMAIISQSIFGVAGVMFSMTIVAVSFASGNFGPRLIGNFMRDRGNQRSLGILIATFVYALLITRAIRSPTGADATVATELFIPHLSIAMALILTLVSVFTVIYFVHHIPETINVSNITADLGKRLVADIKQVIEDEEARDEPNIGFPDRAPDDRLKLRGSGYIQTMNISRLYKLAAENSVLVRVPQPVGQFVTEHTVVLELWGDEVSDETAANFRDCLALGQSPTEKQNPLFIVNQLVEMIARAMSPGVNDPYTAINCLNWLHTVIVTAANHSNGLRQSSYGAVKTQPLEFGDLLDEGFGQSLHYIVSDPLCSEQMRHILTQLARQIDETEFRATLLEFKAHFDEQVSSRSS